MVENGETEKLSPEPKMRDASTGMSQERLSLMIKYNQIGSLTSLSRGSKVSSSGLKNFQAEIFRRKFNHCFKNPFNI